MVGRSWFIAGASLILLIGGILAVWAISPRGATSSQTARRSDPPARATVMVAETAVAAARDQHGAVSLTASPCPQVSRSYTETVVSTRSERLALWDEAMRRSQAWLVSLSPNDARRETEALLAQRATIVAGSDTVTQQIPFTEVSEVCPSTSPAPPGTNAPAPAVSLPPVVSPGSPVSTDTNSTAGTPSARFTPTAKDCQIDPVSDESLLRVFASPPAPTAPVSDLPARIAAGTPADDVTIDGITATVREYLACQIGGDQLRLLALLTDDVIRVALTARGIGPADLEQLATPRHRSHPRR